MHCLQVYYSNFNTEMIKQINKHHFELYNFTMLHKSACYTQTRPVCTQDSVHNCITDPIMDGLPIGTADEELVLKGREKADGGSA